MTVMDIHQMQVVYERRADRLLWQVRTRDGALYGVWLTRRLMMRLWPPFQRLVADAALAQVSTAGALALPQAREMMAEVARHKPLPGANFEAPFDSKPTARPLGPEPLLPEHVELTPRAATGSAPRALVIRIREHEGRSLDLQLTEDLSIALMRLMEKALGAAEWWPSTHTPAAPVAEPAAPPRWN
jgi:hypothetical protein